MDSSTMLSIKEFSDFTGLSESTLRYYDKIGLLSPVCRGENRYRYYTPFQTIMINFIKVLSSLGVSLSVIRTMSNERTPQRMLALLAQQEKKLNMRLVDLQTTYSIIHTFRDNIQTGISVEENDIGVQEMEEICFALGQVNDFANSKTFYGPFMRFCSQAHENKINLKYPIGGYYETLDVFLKEPSQPTRFFSLDPSGDNRRKAGKYLVAYQKGYYGELEAVPKKLLAYAKKHNITLSGPLFVIYLLDEVSVINHTQYLSQVMVGVSKK